MTLYRPAGARPAALFVAHSRAHARFPIGLRVLPAPRPGLPPSRLFNIRVLTPGFCFLWRPPLETPCLQLSWPCSNVSISRRASSRFRLPRGASDLRLASPRLTAKGRPGVYVAQPDTCAWTGSTRGSCHTDLYILATLLFYLAEPCPPRTVEDCRGVTHWSHSFCLLCLLACLTAFLDSISSECAFRMSGRYP